MESNSNIPDKFKTTWSPAKYVDAPDILTELAKNETELSSEIPKNNDILLLFLLNK